ncbi:MAG TPA: hypothetical protein VF964_05150, partial [Vicinamibacteria bacterium]
VEIAAVYGENTAKAERLAATYGGRAYRELDPFLSHRPMDLVAIGSPSGSRPRRWTTWSRSASAPECASGSSSRTAASPTSSG